MKNVVTILASVSLVVLLSMIVNIKLSSNVSAQPVGPGGAVVMIGCAQGHLSDPPYVLTTFNVIAANSSSNAPTISLGTDCAQALATLFSLGFEITSTHVQTLGLDLGGGALVGPLYTLSTPIGKLGGKDK